MVENIALAMLPSLASVTSDSMLPRFINDFVTFNAIIILSLFYNHPSFCHYVVVGKANLEFFRKKKQHTSGWVI